MSDTDQHDQEQEQEQDNLQGLRDAARKGKAALDENAELKRQLLFAKAGIDTTSEVGEMIFRTWDGGDNVDDLKAKAQRLGLLSATAPADAARAAEDAQRAGAYDAGAGGQPTGAAQQLGEHPRDAALKGFQTALRDGADREMAQIDAMAMVLGAGTRGDQRVFFNQAEHEAKAAEIDRLNQRSR